MASVTIDAAQPYTSAPQPEPDVHVLHTTEGMGWPGYEGGGTAPHDTIRAVPGVGIVVRRHFPYGHYARALANTATPGETNRRGVIQTELVGTCDPRHRGDPAWYYWPDADDVVLRALADYYRPTYAKYGIPGRAPTFLPYPESYGPTQVRMSPAQFARFEGICGHQHVPENTHGDPGLFPVARYLALAFPPAVPEEDDDMRLTDKVPLSPLVKRLMGTELDAISVGGLLQYAAAAAFVSRRTATAEQAAEIRDLVKAIEAGEQA